MKVAQKFAIMLAETFEKTASKHLLHVALTGGCLYKEGSRKDAKI